MFESHSGVKNECIKLERSHNFLVALSYLEHESGQAWFVLHVNPGPKVTGVLSPDDFLLMLGFEAYPKTCVHLHRPCYSKKVYHLPSKSVGVQVGVREFNLFMESIDELYKRASAFTTLAGQHTDFIRWGKELWKGPRELEPAGEAPSWLAESRLAQHQEALDALREAESTVRHFETIEYCLWGTGDRLVDSVHYILSDLGLQVGRTQEGYSVDLIVDYEPREIEIGMEVTGKSGSIKKSKKLVQPVEFCLESENPRKAVILANTHKDTPLDERDELEDFTEPAAKWMARTGIVGLTTVQLCRIWQDVKENRVEVDEVVGQVCDHSGGVLQYAPVRPSPRHNNQLS